MKVIKIQDLDIPKVVKNVLEQENYVELYPPQAMAIEKGALDGKNLLLAIPTAAGKTLVSELAILKSIFEKNGKAVYLVPLRALANEKYEYFKKWEKYGVKVNISTSDYDKDDYWLKDFQLIICTNEKFDSLFRHQAKWIKDVTVFVLDEVHLLNDLERGPTLEILITNIKQINKQAQIIALSATVKNAEQVAGWLDAVLVISEWRPVKLREGVYLNGIIYFSDDNIQLTKVHADPVIDLVIDTVKNKKQALIFTDTRRSAIGLAKNVSKSLLKYLKATDRKELADIAKKILSVGGETNIRSKLADFILKGVAFHHAGLISEHRALIEKSFKENKIKILCATPTLAAGVNLPARRVIIHKYSRFDTNFGNRPIPILEYKQFAGRAGRPKYDTEGESIIISYTENEKEFLLNNYILGEPEPINSRLAQESVLRTHILAFIAMEGKKSKNNIMEFIKQTFFAYQNSSEDFFSIIDEVIHFLKEEKLIEDNNNFIIPTILGKRISQLYIDPKSGILMKNAILNIKDTDDITSIGILHLIARTQDIPKLYLRRKDYEEIIQFANEHRDEFLFEIKRDENFEWFLSEVKVTYLIYLWMNEIDEDTIINKCGVGSGDIHRYVELYDWLMYSLIEIAKLYKKSDLKKIIEMSRLRIKYGIKDELLELVSLKGIGRVRARILYKHGYSSLDSIKKAREQDLMKLEFFGPEIVKSIFNQIGISIGKLTSNSTKDKLKTNQKSIDDYI